MMNIRDLLSAGSDEVKLQRDTLFYEPKKLNFDPRVIRVH